MSEQTTPRRRRFAPFGRRGLSVPTFASWQASMRAAGLADARVLAWAPIVPELVDARPVSNAVEPAAGLDETGGTGLVIGSPGALSLRRAGHVGDEEWRHVGWHEIEKGEWNGEDRELRWSTYDGVRAAVRLADPARLPELFRERIAASIAVEETLDVGRGRQVVISGRRDLAHPGSTLEWRRTLSRGLSPSTPGLAELTEDTLERMRAEYDPS